MKSTKSTLHKRLSSCLAATLILNAAVCTTAAGLSALTLTTHPALAEPASSADAGSESSGAAAGQNGNQPAANITELDTKGSDTEYDAYLKENKEHLKLLQQHEAVQHYNAAKHYMSIWDADLSELELRAAIMYMPDLKIAHRDYCLLALLHGKPLRSLAEFLMVVGLGDPIPLNEKQQKELRIEASRAHYKRGLDFAKDGKWDDAISELFWSKTYMPSDPAISRSLAFAYASKGDFKTAQSYYQSALSVDPNDPYAHADYAFLLSDKGHADQAFSEMALAVKLNPNATALHVDLGYLAESKGDWQTAYREFSKAAQLSPRHAILWYHLGEVLQKLNRAAEARSAYQKALALEPDDMQVQEALSKLGPAPAKTNDGASKAEVRDNVKPPAVVDANTEAPVKDDSAAKHAADTGKVTKLK